MARDMTLLLLTLLIVVPSKAHSADPPTTLDELVKEYERLELPFPPAGTKFVIIESGYDGQYPEDDGIYHIRQWFGLLANPKSKSNPEASIYGSSDIPVLLT